MFPLFTNFNHNNFDSSPKIKEKVYCGDKQNIPRGKGYVRKGFRSECLRKGVGVGMGLKERELFNEFLERKYENVERNYGERKYNDYNSPPRSKPKSKRNIDEKEYSPPKSKPKSKSKRSMVLEEEKEDYKGSKKSSKGSIKKFFNSNIKNLKNVETAFSDLAEMWKLGNPKRG